MSDTSRLSRLTAILLILQGKRLVTATALAEKFDISVRTVYRDIRALEAAGLPIVTEEGKGYSLLEGYRLPPVMFSEQEANAMITAQKLIARNKDASLVTNYNDAIAKIKAVLNYSSKVKTELLEDRVAFVRSYSPLPTSNFLSTIQIAITDSKLLRIKYQRITDLEVSIREIEPLALYHTSDNWILISWCRMREANREFRLDRMQTLELLDTEFEARPFDFAEYFAEVMARKK